MVFPYRWYQTPPSEGLHPAVVCRNHGDRIRAVWYRRQCSEVSISEDTLVPQVRQGLVRPRALGVPEHPGLTQPHLSGTARLLIFPLRLPSPGTEGVTFDSGAGVVVHAFRVRVISGLAATCADALCFCPEPALPRYLTVSKETGWGGFVACLCIRAYATSVRAGAAQYSTPFC